MLHNMNDIKAQKKVMVLSTGQVVYDFSLVDNHNSRVNNTSLCLSGNPLIMAWAYLNTN